MPIYTGRLTEIDPNWIKSLDARCNSSLQDRILALDSSWLQRAPTLLAVVLGSFFFSTVAPSMINFGTGVDVVLVGVDVVGATGGAGLLLEKISSPYLAISSAWLKTALLLGEDLLNERGYKLKHGLIGIGRSQATGVTKRVAPGCENSAHKARQSRLTKAGLQFTKPWVSPLWQPLERMQLININQVQLKLLLLAFSRELANSVKNAFC